jgi:hypothetical protein
MPYESAYKGSEVDAAVGLAATAVQPSDIATKMDTLVYDPRGIADDTFDLANLTGNLDGGTF